MHWTLADLMALPVSYYISLGRMLDEDAQK